MSASRVTPLERIPLVHEGNSFVLFEEKTSFPQYQHFCNRTSVFPFAVCSYMKISSPYAISRFSHSSSSSCYLSRDSSLDKVQTNVTVYLPCIDATTLCKPPGPFKSRSQATRQEPVGDEHQRDASEPRDGGHAANQRGASTALLRAASTWGAWEVANLACILPQCDITTVMEPIFGSSSHLGKALL
jgi:hypothetical protein